MSTVKKKPKVIGYKKYEELQEEYEKLKAQLEEKLSSMNQNDYERRYRELAKDYEKLVHEAEEAEEKVKQLEIENNVLRGDIRGFKDRLDNAVNSNMHYSKRIEELETELLVLQKYAFLHLRKAVKVE